MTILYCTHCGDAVRLQQYERRCKCAMCKGRATRTGALYEGDALVLSVDEATLQLAHAMQPALGTGRIVPVRVPAQYDKSIKNLNRTQKKLLLSFDFGK